MDKWLSYRVFAPGTPVRFRLPQPGRKAASLFIGICFWKEVLTEAVTTAINVTPLVTALTTSVTPADVVTLLAVVIGAGMGFVLVWFGSRKVTSGFMGALKKGRLRI